MSSLLSSYARALENTEGSNLEALYHVLDGSAEAIEFLVKDDWKHLGETLSDMKTRENILIGGIIRGRRPIIPSGRESIQSGDRVIVISSGRKLGDISDIIKEED